MKPLTLPPPATRKKFVARPKKLTLPRVGKHHATKFTFAGVNKKSTAFRSLKDVVSKLPPDSATFDVKGFCTTYGIKREHICRMTGISARTVAGWAAGQPLTAASRQKVRELKRLFEAMHQVIKPKFIGPWLVQPNSAFDGAMPLHLIERGEVDLLWRMIYDLGSGEPG